MRTTPDAQTTSAPSKKMERQVFSRVLQRRTMSLSPGGMSMGESSYRSVLNRRITLETDDMFVMKKGCRGAGLHRGRTRH